MAGSWNGGGLDFPGYKNAYISFKNIKTGESITQDFLVSPSGFSEQRSNISQLNKTITGWFIQRGGRNPISINLSGYVLDAKNVGERLNFISNYVKCAEDTRNDKYEFVNYWEQTLYVEGIEYKGIIQAISFSKNAMQPFLYQYNLSFLAYKDTKVFYQETDTRRLEGMHMISSNNNSTKLTQSMVNLLSGR